MKNTLLRNNKNYFTIITPFITLLIAFGANRINAQTITQADFSSMLGKTSSYYTSQYIDTKLKLDSVYWNFTKSTFYAMTIEKEFASTVPNYACKDEPNFKQANFYIKDYSQIPYSWSHLQLGAGGLDIIGTCEDTIKTYYKGGLSLVKLPLTEQSKWESNCEIITNNPTLPSGDSKLSVTDSAKVIKSGTLKFQLPVSAQATEIKALLLEHKQYIFIETLGNKNILGFVKNYLWITNYSNNGYVIIAEMRTDPLGNPSFIKLYSPLVTNTKSVADNNNLSNSNVAPNPAKNMLKIKFNLAASELNKKRDEDVSIAFFNDNGNPVSKVLCHDIIVGTNTKEVDITNFANGNYFYSIIFNDKIIAKNKFVILK